MPPIAGLVVPLLLLYETRGFAAAAPKRFWPLWELSSLTPPAEVPVFCGTKALAETGVGAVAMLA